jgi:hypothetical protein
MSFSRLPLLLIVAIAGAMASLDAAQLLVLNAEGTLAIVDPVR